MITNIQSEIAKLDPNVDILETIQTFLRLYISSQAAARGDRKFSLIQLAIEFEIEQASRLADTPHTVSSLAKLYDMPKSAVSRITGHLIENGMIEQKMSPADRRVRYLTPTNAYYESGGLGIFSSIRAFLDHNFGESWRTLSREKHADQFMHHSSYRQATSDIDKFRNRFLNNSQ